MLTRRGVIRASIASVIAALFVRRKSSGIESIPAPRWYTSDNSSTNGASYDVLDDSGATLSVHSVSDMHFDPGFVFNGPSNWRLRNCSFRGCTFLHVLIEDDARTKFVDCTFVNCRRIPWESMSWRS